MQPQNLPDNFIARPSRGLSHSSRHRLVLPGARIGRQVRQKPRRHLLAAIGAMTVLLILATLIGRALDESGRTSAAPISANPASAGRDPLAERAPIVPLPPTIDGPKLACLGQPTGQRGDVFGAGLYAPRWIGPRYEAVNWNGDYLIDARFGIETTANDVALGGSKFYLRFGHQPTDGLARGNETVVDGYQWKDALLPGSEATNIDEYMAFIRSVGAEPQVVVNFGSGSIEDAADLVAYANGTDPADPMVALRISRGHPEPYAVAVWEIGNEQYGNWAVGNNHFPEDPTKPGSSDPNSFARRVVAFALAMRVRSPSAVRLLAPLTNWDLQSYSPQDLISIVDSTAAALDGYVVHYYPESGLDESDPSSTVGATEALAANLAKLRRLIDTTKSERHLEIAVTEYAPTAFPSETGKTWTAGLMLIDSTLAMATHGVSLANYFAAFAPAGDIGSYSLWNNGDLNSPSPAHTALVTAATQTGKYIVDSRIEGAPTLHGSVTSSGRPEFAYSTLSALCSESSADTDPAVGAGKNRHLAIVNRSSLAQSISIDSGLTPDQPVSATTLSGSPNSEVIDRTETLYAPVGRLSLALPPFSATFLAFHGSDAT